MKYIKNAKNLGIIIGVIAALTPSVVIGISAILDKIIWKIGLHSDVKDIFFESGFFSVFLGEVIFPVHSFIGFLGATFGNSFDTNIKNLGTYFMILFFLMTSAVYGIFFYYIGKNLYTIKGKKSKIIVGGLLIFMIFNHLSVLFFLLPLLLSFYNF